MATSGKHGGGDVRLISLPTAESSSRDFGDLRDPPACVSKRRTAERWEVRTMSGVVHLLPLHHLSDSHRGADIFRNLGSADIYYRVDRSLIPSDPRSFGFLLVSSNLLFYSTTGLCNAPIRKD